MKTDITLHKAPSRVLRLSEMTKLLADRRTNTHFAISIRELELSEGELVAVAGPTGSGKTTLLQVLGGLSAPTCAEEFVITDTRCTGDGIDYDLGRLWRHKRSQSIENVRRKLFGFALQQPRLIGSFTVAENVAIPLKLNRIGNSEQRVNELLNILSVPNPDRTPDLVGVANRLPHLISGGQAQRVGLARAIAHKPQLLLADEPTNNLDDKTARHVLNILNRMRSEYGMTIVMVTHDERAIEHADRLIRMDIIDEDLGAIVEDCALADTRRQMSSDVPLVFAGNHRPRSHGASIDR